MERLPRNIYTYEFKLKAVRLVESGQSIAEAARSLGVVEQTLWNWIKAHKFWQAGGQRARLEVDGRTD